jgi:hypothetical protein
MRRLFNLPLLQPELVSGMNTSRIQLTHKLRVPFINQNVPIAAKKLCCNYVNINTILIILCKLIRDPEKRFRIPKPGSDPQHCLQRR